MTLTTTVTAKDDLIKITQRSLPELRKIVRETAFEVERDAKTMAVVDTGAMRASIYASVWGGGSYGRNVLEAARRRPGVLIFPEARPQSDLEAMVGVGVEYGEYVEYGVARRAAKPFLIPAVQGVRERFIQRCQKAMGL